MTKMESRNWELSPEWVRVENVISSSISAFEGMAKQKGLSLNWDNQLACDIEIFLDQEKLKQVLINYISNAIKFTHLGSVDVILAGEVLSKYECSIELSITDTGIGISNTQELLKTHSQEGSAKKQNGTGRGLIISEELIEMMGGDFNIHSKINGGTTIDINFHVKYRLTNLIETLATLPENTPSESLTILIVDDQAIYLHLLKHQLMNLGHRVESAQNGADALVIWEEKNIDLIITDCQMPVMDGKTLARSLRTRGSTAVIWGLTARADQEEVSNNISAGMNHCFIKPLNPNILEEFLGRIKK